MPGRLSNLPGIGPRGQYKLKTPDRFYLSDGSFIQLKAVSLARVRAAQTKAKKEMEAKGISFEKPSFTIEGVIVAPGVDPPTQPYDDETIKNAAPEVKLQYEELKENLKRMQKLATVHMVVTLLMRGTEYELPDNGWEADQIEDGLEVPEKADEKYLHYLTTELLIPPSMAQSCALQILELSLEGVDPEVVKTFRETFRNPLQDADWRDLGSDSKEAEEG